MTATTVHLYLGVLPVPAPLEIAAAFDSLTVTQTDSGVSSGWQIALRADRTANPADDAALVLHPLLKPFSRVVAAVSIGSARTEVLLDGVITHIELTPSQNGQGAMLTVTGDSIDALLSLKDFTLSWPAVTDAGIVALVLAKYLSIGVMPSIVPPIPPAEFPDPFEGCVVQNSTDACFLRYLAKRYGYVFYIKPGPSVGMNTAYWGPPPRSLPPQKALTVDMGPGTNVDALSISYDAKAPTLVFGSVKSEFLDMDVPVITTIPTRLPPLAARPAVVAQLPLVDSKLYANPAYGPTQALWEANAITQTSTDRVVVAKGTVDTARYGHVLDVPGVVGVRGAGQSHDGLYYIHSVTHHLGIGTYTQEFELSREGNGSTTMTVPA